MLFRSSYAHRPGRWVCEPDWPSANVTVHRFVLGQQGLQPGNADVDKAPMTIQSPLTVGLFAGKWCSYAAGPDLAHDQRQEDGGALVFESDPLDENLELLGAAVVRLELASDKPLAMVAVRLSDVAPDDKATRVTYGLLNLTHRNSREQPEALTPGEPYRVSVRLNDAAQVFPEGHRIRISISTSYWPLAWPPPSPVRLTIYAGSSLVELPARNRLPEDEELRPFDVPQGAAPAPRRRIEGDHHNWLLHRDLASDISTLEVINDNGIVYLEDIDLEVENRAFEWYSSLNDDFLSPKGETRLIRGLKRGHWSVRTIAHTILTSTDSEFRINADLDAFENGNRVYSHNWNVCIPRDFV